MIEVTSEQVERIHLLLGGIKDAPRNAVYNVLNRATGTVVSQSSKHIRRAYTVKHGALTSNSNIKVSRAGRTNLEATISYAGTLIPLINFSVDPKQPKRKAVSVSVLQNGGGKRLLHAYVANLGRYGVGVFERETSKRESSKQLYGPSTVHMVENEDVLSKVTAAAMETIDKRVEHEITRILNGYT